MTDGDEPGRRGPAPRSYLYVPGDAADKLERALTRRADAVIIDLEDAVAPTAKAAARSLVRDWLAGLSPVGRRRAEVWVRVNPWPSGRADVEAVVCPALTGICLAKVGDAAELVALDAALSHAEEACSLPARSIPVQPLIENARAVLGIQQIAAAPRVERMQLGEVDLAADLGAEPDADGTEMLLARSQVVLAGAAAGLGFPVAPVQAEFRDAVRFARTTVALKRLGFGSRACIHPCQILAVNDAFTPTPAEIEEARSIVDSFEDAVARGSGVVASGQRQMVDEAVVRSARRLLARAARSADDD